MKFEEVLPLMREGKKAYLKDFRESKSWIVCRVCILGDKPEDGVLGLACIDKEGRIEKNSKSWGISRWALLDEGWEILDED